MMVDFSLFQIGYADDKFSTNWRIFKGKKQKEGILDELNHIFSVTLPAKPQKGMMPDI